MFRVSVGRLQPSISPIRNRLILFNRRSAVGKDVTPEVDCHSHSHVRIMISFFRLITDDEFFSEAAARLGSEGFSDDVMENIGDALFTAADAYNFISDLL